MTRRLASEQRARERMDPITEAQFQTIATAKAEVCPWCNLPVEKVSETVSGTTWFFYRHALDAPKCQGMWTVMEEKP